MRDTRALRRAAVVIGLLLALLSAATATASAQPVDPGTIPDNLRKYVVDSPQWVTAPWMTDPACKDHGGDFSRYARSVIDDAADLYAFFQPDVIKDDHVNGLERSQAILQAYRDAAAVTVPAGYCVDMVRTWAPAAPDFKPFGFRWGDGTNTGGERHATDVTCSNTIGADNAPCGGFYVSCAGAVTQQQHQQCQAWNAFSDDYVQRVQRGRAAALAKFPNLGEDDPIWGTPSEIAQDIMDWTVETGIAGFVQFVVQGVTQLWAMFLTIVVTGLAPNLAGSSFAAVYNLVSGVALAVAFLGWLVTVATAWKQGRLQYALVGGVKAATAATLAGVGAILMQQLATECTESLLLAGGDLGKQADFTQSLAKTNPLVGLLVGLVMALCLIFALVFMVINGALTLMWALLGGIAAAGQVHPASSVWLLKWAGRGTALAWSPFVMVAVMLLAQSLMLPLQASESLLKQIVDVVQGLALVLALVASPMILWELVEFVSDRAGGAAAVGGRATGRAAAMTDRAAAAGRSAVGRAVQGLQAGAEHLAQRFSGARGGGSGAPASPASLPRSEGGPVKPPARRASTPAGETASDDSRSGTGTKEPDTPPPSGSASSFRDRPSANRGRVVARNFVPPEPAEPPPAGDGGETPPPPA
ncbi:hypothetical protein ACFWQL_05360 [Amycolatopsis thermoflava]|uniref:hypothetical protein n=1 Tax=Amycolatopsis thermoflava TaxID=84480 RepID=UPI00364E1A7B